jgi:hypothetical protein
VRLHAHEHVGYRALQSGKFDALATEAARRGDDPALDNRVRELVQPWLDEVFRLIGKP